MTKTLIVSYTPRTGSYTRQLLNEFIKLSEDKTEITYLDLTQTPPDLLLEENLNLVMKRNTGQAVFSESELLVLDNHHKMVEQLLAADNVVVATPIYNFSLPATVKAWIDAIVVSDKTFKFTPEKGFEGLCGDKKALILAVSGFDYTKPSTKNLDFASPLIKTCLSFIGMPSEQISAFGVDENRDKLDEILTLAKQKIGELVNKWY